MSRKAWTPLTVRNLMREEAELIVVLDPKNRTYSGRWSGTGMSRIMLENGFTETSVPTGVEGWCFYKLPSPATQFGIAEQPKLLD